LVESPEKDKKYKNFLRLIKSLTRELTIDTPQKWQQKGIELSKLLDQKKSDSHQYLEHNFDTGSVFTEIGEIVKATNTYMSSPELKLLLLKSISDYLLKLFGMFSLDYTEEIKQTSERDV
jgi:cysteinyl-tRNA synthetase